MSAFAACLAFTLAQEGGWSDRTDDAGGSTMRGVTLATFSAWRRAHDRPPPTVEDLRGISDAELQAIYGSGYWNPVHGDQLPPGLALMTFDMAVNAGTHRSAVMLQRALGMTGADVDGWIGLQTVSRAIGVGADPRSALAELAALHQLFYFGCPGYPTFGRGWLARCNRRLLAAAELAR